PSAPGVGLVADHERYRQHNHLRGDDARRHHGRRERRMLRGERLADQRQERRVGEMEQHRTAAKMSSGRHSRSTFQFDGLLVAAALFLSRPLALSWSMACAGMDRTASAASTEENGTREKTARCDRADPTRPASAAMTTLPAWSKAEL